MTARWAGADEFKLRYVGSISEVLTESYEQFKTKMQKESDECYTRLFVWNQEKTVADASPVIINADCLRKDTYGWTAATIDYASGEAYDGTLTNNYWNKWSSTAFTSELYQDFNYLPEGTYTVSALLRCSAGATIQLYTVRDKNGVKETGTKTFTGTGATPPAGSSYLKGWDIVTASSIEIRRGDILRIGFETSLTNQWWSADHFTFKYEPLKLSGINQLMVSNLVLTSGTGYVILKTDIPTDISIYNVSGVLVNKRTIGTGETKINLPSGVYLVNRQKIIVR
ncbi:MAG: T9SS type A sorting domain-containing protein [Paludibacteraceae bacterium]